MAALFSQLLLAASIPLWVAAAAENTHSARSTPWVDLHFADHAPYAARRAMMRHLGYGLPVPEFDLGREKFRVFVPDAYRTNEVWGLLVWVSPGDDPRIPKFWEKELAEQHLLCVSAYQAGNQRHAIERCRLSLDAVFNMSRRYKLDPNRLYIGGFSGGGRIASIMGVAYADLFTGTIAICGADFYSNVRAGSGEVFHATYQPSPGVLARAKAVGRFVLVTGEHDTNRENTKATAENGFKRQGFRHCLYLEIAGMGHTTPTAQTFRQALQFLRSTPPDSAQPQAPLPVGAD